jgi:hypothetical protein
MLLFLLVPLLLLLVTLFPMLLLLGSQFVATLFVIHAPSAEGNRLIKAYLVVGEGSW